MDKEILQRHIPFASGTSCPLLHKPATLIPDEPEVENQSALWSDCFAGEIEQLSDHPVPLPVIERG